MNSEGKETQFFRFGTAPPQPKFGAEQTEIQPNDIRFARSYFVIPFLDDREVSVDAQQVLQDATGRLHEHINQLPAAVTDVYILSHGWHRNLYSAVAAYDRLISRFATLVHRKRIQPPPDWNPLFLTVHWHSDLGRNEWIDQAGRRDKDSFIRLAFERLQARDPNRHHGDIRTDFEQLFEFFVKVCAPEIDPFAGGIEKDSLQMGTLLDQYTIRDAPAASPPEVYAAAWTCYHEAPISKPVSEQDEAPGEFTRPFAYVAAIFRIAAAVLGISALLGLILRNPWVLGKIRLVGALLQDAATRVFPTFGSWPTWQKTLIGIAAVYLFAWITVGIVVLLYRRKGTLDPDAIRPGPLLDPRLRKRRRAKGLKLIGTLAWAFLQLIHALPILIYCLVSPIFSSIYLQLLFVAFICWYAWTTPWLMSLAVVSLLMFLFSRYQFQERSAIRQESFSLDSILVAIGNGMNWVRRLLVGFARQPIQAICPAVSPDDRALPAWMAVDNQFAFWDMVQKAVRSAERAADWMTFLCNTHPDKLNSGTRIHLFGHSHGGLLTMNLGRNLSKTLADGHPKLHSVTTICGAFMSSWLRGEKKLLDAVAGSISCIYSRYDVANSFWYPLANIGRKAAGFVGLWLGDPHPDPLIAEPLPYASISSVPELAHRIESVGQDPQVKKVLNIDASRIIYEGPVIPQGAHNDIFKDDVVLLLWACTQFEPE